MPVTPQAPTVHIERRELPSPTSGTERPAQRIPEERGPASTRLERKAPSPSWGPVTRRVDPHPAPAKDPAPRTVPKPATDPAPQSAPSPRLSEPRPAPDTDGPYTFDARHWRGLSRKQLNAVGPLAIQKSTDVEVRVFPGGRLKVLVDALRSEGIW